MPIKAKKYRDRNNYASNASKRHKAVGALLEQSIFENMVIFQEYPVNLINPDCSNGRLKVDWYIKTLNIAIEVQGEHHYQPVQYGGQSKDKATNSFVKQAYKDTDKIRYCEQAGCPVIEIHYKDKISLQWLLARIKDASSQVQTPKTKTKRKTKSEWEENVAEQRRAYNREQYRRLQNRRRGK
jgi:hypothetical protein